MSELLTRVTLQLGISSEQFTVLAGGLVIILFFLVNIIASGKKNDKGDVSMGLKREQESDPTTTSADTKPLNPAIFKPFKLMQTTQISHNSKLLKFEIPGDQTLGLTVGRHVSVRAQIDGNNVMRAYTPTSSPYQQGFFELLVKTYEYGKMSPYIHSMKVGDVLEVRGPVGRFKYSVNQCKSIGLVAGGSGITPCLQVIRCIFEGPDYSSDKTTFTLFYQNRTDDDILLKKDLDDYQAK